MQKKIILLILLMFFGILPSFSEDKIIVEDYIDISTMYEQNGDYNKALEYIEIVESVEPYNPKIKYKKALLLKYLGKPQESMDTFLLALKLEPDFESSELYGEFCETKKSEEKVIPPDKIEHLSVEPVEQKTQEIAYNSEYYNKKGKELYLKGNFDEAKQYFKKAIKLDRKNKLALNNLGMLYWQNFDTKTAIKYFLKAHKVDAKYTQPLINLSLLYKQKGDDINRLKYLQIALENNKDDYCVYYLLGNYYYEKCFYDLAIENYSNSVIKNQNFLESYVALATLLFEKEDYERADEVLQKALENNLQSDRLYFLLSRTALMSDNKLQAKKYIESAIELKPSDKYYLELAKIEYYVENYEVALELFKKYSSAENQEQMANYIGLCEYKLGQINPSIEEFKKALILNKKAIYYYNLALCYKSQNEKSLYVKYLQKAFAIEPQIPQDYVDLAFIYKDYGNSQLALQFLSSGIEKFPEEKKLYYAKLKLYEALDDMENYVEFKKYFRSKFFRDKN